GLLPVSAQANDPLIFLRSIGGTGGGDGQMYNPHGLGVDAGGYLYVADSGNLRVELFAPSGAFLTSWRPATAPFDVAIGPDGTIFVSLGVSIAVYAPDRTLQRSWPGTCGCIAVDPTGQYLYTTLAMDMYKYRISDGVLLKSWQYTSVSPGVQLGLGVGPSGNVYASANGYVAKYSPDGALLDRWQPVSGAAAVTVDADENVFITDGASELQKYTSGGTLLGRTVTQGATLLDVAVDTNRDVYVLSQGTNQVLVY